MKVTKENIQKIVKIVVMNQCQIEMNEEKKMNKMVMYWQQIKMKIDEILKIILILDDGEDTQDIR